MANFSLFWNKKKKLFKITFFSTLGILVSSVLAASIYASMDHNDSYVVSSEAEFVSIGTEEAPAIIPVGTYTAKKAQKNTVLNTKEGVTEIQWKELCNEDKKKLWSKIICSWEKTKSSTTNQPKNIDNEELIVVNTASGIIACGNPDTGNSVQYTPQNNRITIKKSECLKNGGFIWMICENYATEVQSIQMLKKWHKMSCRLAMTRGKLGTFMRYIDNSVIPSEVQNKVTKLYAYIKCRVGYTNPNDVAFRCTWNDEEIYSYKPVVTEQLGTYKLYFEWNSEPDITTNSITQDAALTSCKATQATDLSTSLVCTWNDIEIYSYVSDHIVSSTITCVFSGATTEVSRCTGSDYPEYSCSGIQSCAMTVTGFKWNKLAFYLNDDIFNSITTLFSRFDDTLVFELP